MKKFVLMLFLAIPFLGHSQSALNNYKYVVVPQKFGFLKEINQYSLNTVTKTLLEGKGFTAYFDNTEVPGEVAGNKCRALSADLLEKNGMFTTSITLVLKDCQGNIVFKSKEGKSREKEYEVAYNMALKDAFTSLDQTPYAYKAPTEEAVGTTTSPTPQKQVAAAVPAIAQVPEKQPVVTSTAPVKTNEIAAGQPVGTLYAQAITNGYQLIDTTPKIVLTLLKTSAENYYIAGNATANGIVLKKGEDWVFEYYKDGKLVSEKLSVKF
jgi:hypothetical protein